MPCHTPNTFRTVGSFATLLSTLLLTTLAGATAQSGGSPRDPGARSASNGAVNDRTTPNTGIAARPTDSTAKVRRGVMAAGSAGALELANGAEAFPESFSVVILNRAELVGEVARNGSVTIELPLGPSRIATVALEDAGRSTPTVVGARVGEDGEIIDEPLPAPTMALFRGAVAGEADSFVVLGISDGMTAGLVQSEGRTYVISSGPANSGLPTVSYEVGATPAELLNITVPTCSAEELDGYALSTDGGATEGGIAGLAPCRALTMAVETDVEYLQNLFGGDTTAATNYTALLFTALSEIYRAQLSVRIELDFVRLWTFTEDIWDGTTTSAQLSEFRDVWVSVMAGQPRELAHMLSGRPLGGGVAWLNAVCSFDYGYGLSANLNGFFPYPLVSNNGQNWDIMVTAHEIGHNCGAPHTHSYNPPLDGCGNGDCSQSALGTIMSYCHTCPGGMSNIALSFHPENVVTMSNFIGGTGCMATGLPNSVSDDSFLVASAAPRELDVLANDFRNDCTAATIDSFPQTTAAGGSLSLSPGSGPDGRDELLYLAPIGFSGADTFQYGASTGSGSPQFATATINVLALRQPDMPGNVVPGLVVDYFSLNDPLVLPNFSLLTPIGSEVVSTVNVASTGEVFAGSGLSDNVGAVYQGFINVSKSEIVTLFVESDDGSRLYVGDTLVVDNDGLHGMVEKSGMIALAKGGHSIRIEFFERGGGAGVIARILDYTGVKKVIPANRLFHGGGISGPDLNGDGVVDGEDLGLLLAEWGAAGGIADLNGDGVVDGSDLGDLLAAWG